MVNFDVFPVVDRLCQFAKFAQWYAMPPLTGLLLFMNNVFLDRITPCEFVRLPSALFWC